MENLRIQWEILLQASVKDSTLIDLYFTRLAKNYHSPRRHYHNFTHIAAMLDLSDHYKNHLQQKDVVDLAIFYHDVIYNPLRKDNEERSARRAVQELKQLHVPKEKTELIEIYILATKTHDLQGFGKESDLAYLLDFDLSVLGADWETYSIYAQNIRKEYNIYPDFIYNPGRMKILQHFLDKPTIYFTHAFREQKEALARQNLQQELQMLHHL